ncbi:Uncharacterised protein [Mycobacteroides abscessus subsp. massiliense]|nr:Uncharacterised protein [Mycobacteroides abscessus subsp. massiliense]
MDSHVYLKTYELTKIYLQNKTCLFVGINIILAIALNLINKKVPSAVYVNKNRQKDKIK